MRRINFFVDEKQALYLEGLSGTLSEHIRRALDEYVERKRNINVSTSQSKRGGQNG